MINFAADSPVAARPQCWLGRLLLSASLLIIHLDATAQEMHLAANEKAVEQSIATQLLTEIYKKAGLTLTVEPLPGARANVLALSGEKDGEVARIQPYVDRNPSLVKVEPAYYYLTSAVFAKSARHITIASKAELSNYRVGIVRGIAHAEAATAGLSSVEVISNYEQMFRMLDAGRIDLAIDTGINGRLTLQTFGFKGIEQVGELARLELFHILNAKNKELAPRISKAISALRSSGELDRMTARIEKELVLGSH